MSFDRSDHVFATDLPADITEEVLRAVFGQYGTVQWCKLFNGMGKVAALLQFASQDEATFLVENMNGAVLHDLMPTPVTLTYSEGRKQKKGFGKGGGGGGGGGPYGGGFGGGGFQGGGGGNNSIMMQLAVKGKGKGFGGIEDMKKELQMDGTLPGAQWSPDEGALHIGGMPLGTNDKDIYEIFSPFGAIASGGVKAMLNPDGTCTGVAFVNFLDPNSAQAAIQTLNGRALQDGSTIHVSPKRR